MRLLNPDPPARRIETEAGISSALLDAALALPDRAAAERLERDAATLHLLDPRTIKGEDARTVFWINVYNALRLQVFHRDPPVTSVPMSLSRFRDYGWRIGEHEYSLSIIHHGLLRGNRRPLWTWMPPLLSTWLPPRAQLASGDPRLQAAPAFFDPRIHFALAFGAIGSPSVRPFSPENLEKQLQDAERDYVREHTEIVELATIARVDPVFLNVPAMLRAYRADFGLDTKREALEWVLRRLPDEKRLRLEDLHGKKKLHMGWKMLVFQWGFPEQGWKK